jgi:hypothetical protein
MAFLLILGIIRIRAGHKRAEAQELQNEVEMAWDDTALNITVNPIELDGSAPPPPPPPPQSGATLLSAATASGPPNFARCTSTLATLTENPLGEQNDDDDDDDYEDDEDSPSEEDDVDSEDVDDLGDLYEEYDEDEVDEHAATEVMVRSSGSSSRDKHIMVEAGRGVSDGGLRIGGGGMDWDNTI